MFISLPRPELHGLDRYLQQMDKILEALNYFKKHNQNTVELRDVVSSLIHTPSIEASMFVIICRYLRLFSDI